MFRLIADFYELWTDEASGTQQILDALTDKSLHQDFTKGHRNLGRLGWHLATTLEEMIEHTGLTFSAADFSKPVPDTAQEIAEAYRFTNQSMIRAMKDNWTDETLQEEYEMYGEKWTVAHILNVLLLHQVHHRAQMTVLMRQAGLKVPGLYGPAKEEWTQMGAESPEV